MRDKDRLANRLEKNIVGKPPDMVIQRFPEPALSEVKSFAFKEYSGDYGMALKCIWDYYKGENRSHRIEALENRIEQLEMTLGEIISNQDDEKEEEKGERAIDGSTIIN